MMTDELDKVRKLLSKTYVYTTKLERELEVIKEKATESVAIIGMACRFPGGANSIEKFWQLLTQGYDGIAEVPLSRWDINQYYDPDEDAPGKMNTRKGGFLNIDI